MAQQKLPVAQDCEVLRLKAAPFSDRKIAAVIGSARSTVQECVHRAVSRPCPAAIGRSGQEHAAGELR